MRRNITFWIVLVVAIVVATILYTAHFGTAVFDPAGVLGTKEKNLIIFASLLAVIVVVPTFILTIYISLKYREGNKSKKKYNPDFDHSRLYESIWWGIPIVIIGVLSVVAWNSAHTLDPYQQIASHEAPLEIKVVSMDWKWLFIYPDQNIATVNYFKMPVNRPVHFDVTSDTVMSSFWVPSLGGQIYSMPGMKTQINEEATRIGTLHGSNANISGPGFASMTFDVDVVDKGDFDKWVQTVQMSPRHLDVPNYLELAKPNVLKHPVSYASVDQGLFDGILMQNMMPGMSLKAMADKMNMPMNNKTSSDKMSMPMDDKMSGNNMNMSTNNNMKMPSPKVLPLPSCPVISPDDKEVPVQC